MIWKCNYPKLAITYYVHVLNYYTESHKFVQLKILQKRMLFEMRLKEWKRPLLRGEGMTGGQVTMFLKDG